MNEGLVETAVAGAPLVPGTESGDLWAALPFEGGVLVAGIDGLGHGPEAAAASRAAVTALRSSPGSAPAALMTRCHESLRGTRGAAVTLASLRVSGGLTWLGVGNVDAVVLPVDPTRPAQWLVPRGGIVGLRLPTPHERTIPLTPGDTLVLATDGVRGGFAGSIDRRATPADVAETVLSRHRRASDDALVVVVRWRGLA